MKDFNLNQKKNHHHPKFSVEEVIGPIFQLALLQKTSIMKTISLTSFTSRELT